MRRYNDTFNFSSLSLREGTEEQFHAARHALPSSSTITVTAPKTTTTSEEGAYIITPGLQMQ